jgi:beta-lactamase superfamily II metal-dependent hydrolase
MIDIDFLWVGEKTKTGDAITMQFTNPETGRDVVVVIDGGFTEDGDRIASHVRRYYGTNRVDLMISTHPDDDHIRGLSGAIDSLDVDTLVVNRPADFGYVRDNVKAPLTEELIATAEANGTNVISGFAGDSFFGGALKILGPSESYYRELLADQVTYSSITASVGRALSKAASAVMDALRGVEQDPGETLVDDNGGTTPRNNSSIIVALSVDGYDALFTGDAGVPALNDAIDYLESIGGHRTLDFFQLPHHGSRHNLDPTTLDRILGTESGEIVRGSTFVSVGAEADDFPRPEVANAAKRRGYPVLATRGNCLRWNRGGAYRIDYNACDPLGWLAE